MFLYLSSVVPSIWLLEFDKLDKRLELREAGLNITADAINNLTADNINITEELKAIQTFGVSALLSSFLRVPSFIHHINYSLLLLMIVRERDGALCSIEWSAFRQI